MPATKPYPLRATKKTATYITNMQEKKHKPYCHFCGASVGEISEGTDEKVSAIYDCEKCVYNYCDQCSYETEINEKKVQKCLRCESIIEKVC